MYALGLAAPASWIWTIGRAALWLAFLVAWTPVADRIVTRLAGKPPTLGAFKILQESRAKVVLGVVLAWLVGAFLEEILLRGIVVRMDYGRASGLMPEPLAAGLAIVAAAGAAGLVNLY